MKKKTVILVVEDEAIIRMGAVGMLEDAGFFVIEAGNADAAIVILEACRDICAVFTDVNMPGTLDGLRLARAIQDRWPPIHLIVTSGLITPALDDLPAKGRFIRKPYTAKTLVATVRELLASKPPRGPAKPLNKAA